MPVKPQIFKSPDGKEFSTKAAYRDYMMLTYYSFQKVSGQNDPPCIKLPGSIGGQMFDIADCEDSTLIVLDHTEQVQIDQIKNCRVLIAACASSIFIRNCDNCTFYTCCRQLRLRDVTNSRFFIFSMAEVHIEFSSGLQFAPFNGGYPEHAQHLKEANLDVKSNMWYDVYDHNDSGKTHHNWKLTPTEEYGSPWFPIGECVPAIPLTKPGSVIKAGEEENMQSFSLNQLKIDAQKLVPPVPAAAGSELPPPPIDSTSSATPPPIPGPPEADAAHKSAVNAIRAVIEALVGLKAGDDISKVVDSSYTCIRADGSSLTLPELSASAPLTAGFSLREIERVVTTREAAQSEVGDLAFVSYWAVGPSSSSSSSVTGGVGGMMMMMHCTSVLRKSTQNALGWVALHSQYSAVQPLVPA